MSRFRAYPRKDGRMAQFRVPQDVAQVLVGARLEGAEFACAFWIVCRQYQFEHDQGGPQAIPVDELAEKTGCSRATVYRALSGLEAKGVIQKERVMGGSRPSRFALASPGAIADSQTCRGVSTGETPEGSQQVRHQGSPDTETPGVSTGETQGSHAQDQDPTTKDNYSDNSLTDTFSSTRAPTRETAKVVNDQDDGRRPSASANGRTDSRESTGDFESQAKRWGAVGDTRLAEHFWKRHFVSHGYPQDQAREMARREVHVASQGYGQGAGTA